MSDPVERLNAALEGRYAIERELGEGGMATVYLAEDVMIPRSRQKRSVRETTLRRLVLPALFFAAVAACGENATEPATTTAGPPASLIIVSGNTQVDTVGKELPQPLVVRVLDASDEPVPQQVVNFRVISGNGSVFAGVAITGSAGVARERWTLGTVAADTQTVEARAIDNQTGAALIFATFTAVAVPDTAATLQLVSGGVILGDSVLQFTVLGDTATLGATVLDQYGNEVAPRPSVQWTTSDPLVATVSMGGVVTASGPGSATISASSGNLTTLARVTVELPPLALTTSSPMPTGTENVAYSETLTATGGDGSYTWAMFNSTTLPAGLALNTATGEISGTPTVADTTNFEVEVTSAGATATKALSITIGHPAPSVTTTSPMPNGMVSIAYSETLTATGGDGSYTWAMFNSTTLPAGLALNTATGEISGTPTVADTTNFEVEVTSAGQTATKALAITVLSVPTVNFSHAAGIYEEDIAVTLTSSSLGATIHYTLDSTIPTEQSPIYTHPIEIAGHRANTHIKAIAIGTDLMQSGIFEAHYSIQYVFLAEPRFLQLAGIYNEDFSLKLSADDQSSIIYYTLDGSVPSQNSFQYTSEGILIEGDGNSYTIKASQFREGKRPSGIATSFYKIEYGYSYPFEFAELDIWEYSDAIIGTWVGYADTPWVPPYMVQLSFHSDNTYSGTGLTEARGRHSAFYYGIDSDSPLKTYLLDDILGKASGSTME